MSIMDLSRKPWENILLDGSISCPGDFYHAVADRNERLPENGCILLDEGAKRIIENPGFDFNVWGQMDFDKIYPRDFGFRKTYRKSDICIVAVNRGFTLCPPLVALYVRLAYVDQPLNERLAIAMVPVIQFSENLAVKTSGKKEIFLLERDSQGLWLKGIPEAYEKLSNEDRCWLFKTYLSD